MRHFPPLHVIIESGTDDAPLEPSSADASAPRALTRLCLELTESSHEKLHEVNAFLQRNQEELGLQPGEGSLLSRFLRRVWPDGVPTTLIASNISFDRQHPQWLLRPVSWGPAAETYAASHQTLGMEVYRRQGRLVVKGFEVTPHVPRRSHELAVTAPLFWNPDTAWMTAEDFEVLSRLPFHREETRRRLEGWRQYLKWKEALVKKQQLKVPYSAWKWLDEHCVAFLVEHPFPGDRRLDGQELGAMPLEEAEEEGEERSRKPRRRDADLLKLGEVERASAIHSRDERAREFWAQALREKTSHGQVILRLEEDLAERLHQKEGLLPSQGVLVSAIAGELAPLRNQEQAINRLQNSQGFCPRLGDFLFSSANASLPSGPPPELAPLPGTRPLNPGQEEAVAKALAAPDLCLIQGPPGTGKTTVIAELCLRVTAEGGRVLVASQTNLAVDNALSRLADRPHIRRLRLGSADKVDEDYQDFLEDKVVDRWFSTIAEACTERMDEATRLARELAHARQGLDSLRDALKAHDGAQVTLARLRERDDETRNELDARSRRVREARERKEDAHRQAALMRALQAWTDGQGEAPAVPAQLRLPELDAVLREVRTRLSPEDPLASLEGVALLARAVARGAELESLRALLAEGRRRCEGGGAGGLESEFAALMAERQRLSLSEDEADAARLPALNRRIKQLQGAEWSHFTQQLVSSTARVWVSPPLPVQQLTEALQPARALLPAFDALDALTSRTADASAWAARALPSLSQTFATRAHEAQAREEAAERDERSAADALEQLQAAREELLESQQALRLELETAQAKWREAWSALHPDEAPPSSQPSSTDFMAESERQQQSHREVEARLAHRQRWSDIQQEWRQRLGRASESDREHLRALYIQHANVVGMTCNEAGKSKTFQTPGFRPYDLVIIDEVSKATPAELIMPMLLGRKVVLVGDHRQLPPMFREKEASFAEAQAEGDIDADTFKKYQRMVTSSLFQELFEAAPAELKSMLWIQYRMHPQVMDAVNQFYGGRLQPGAGPGESHPREKLGDRRQHHLEFSDGRGGRFLEPHQHLLWVDSSFDARQRPRWEEQRGTSKVNPLEVELMMAMLRQLNVALYLRGYGQHLDLHVERSETGLPLRELVRRRLSHPPEATLDDLFEEKRIRQAGRSQKQERPVQAGEIFHVDARRQVGVITFYGAQLKALREAIDRERGELDAMDIRANTVDRFQGMERPIILASLVRSVRGNVGEFVRQFQRINVGFSRAQELLVIIGAAETFKRAVIELPSLEPREGEAPERKAVYQNIFDLAVRAGGRRHAWQLLS